MKGKADHSKTRSDFATKKKKKKLGSGFSVKKIRDGRVTGTTQFFFFGLVKAKLKLLGWSGR